MYGENKFMKKLMATGKVSDSEIVLFLLTEYFAKGKNIEDFQDDLTSLYDCEDNYAVAMKRSALIAIKTYVKRNEETCETWEEEQIRLEEMKMKKSCLDCRLSYFNYFQSAEHIKDLMCERGYVVFEDEACICDYYEQDLDPSEIIRD